MGEPQCDTTSYESLHKILNAALDQASRGKGADRHATPGTPFDEQLICFIERAGLSFCEGQAVKKIIEAHRTGSDEDKLGAIVYIAANIIVSRENTMYWEDAVTNRGDDNGLSQIVYT